ncbi:MAG: PocR ligand-binding domain-containing protein [Nitrospirota bacterium]
MELTDIMPAEDWRKLAEEIYTRFGLNGGVYDKNAMLVHSSTGWANQICPGIRGGDSRVICISASQRFSKLAKEKKETIIEECDAGFVKFVVPILVNDEFLGLAGGCGSLLEDSEADSFYIGKLLKKEEEEIKDLLTTVCLISQDKLAEAINYVQEKVRENLRKKGLSEKIS